MTHEEENCAVQMKHPPTGWDEESEVKNKKRKLDLETTTAELVESLVKDGNTKHQSTNGSDKCEDPCGSKINKASKAPQSPKKRLKLDYKANSCSKNVKFIYGNYSNYYGYRNKEMNSNAFHDVRLDVFAIKQEKLFQGKAVLDIGCNSGFITMEIAKHFHISHIVGIDIDAKLIKGANKNLLRLKKALPFDNEKRLKNLFPYNISFVNGNYVLKDDVLLEIERGQFDVILCLSVTKWIHLNFGDAGLKQAFRRMFLQLNENGVLILEAQPFKGYGKRKKLTETIFENYKTIKFLPVQFCDYLLSQDVGFTHMDTLGVPQHFIEGFKRPIHVFYKH